MGNVRELSPTVAKSPQYFISDCSVPEIREAYEDVRSDATDTNWLLITYEEGSNNKRWALVGKGAGGLDELKSYINNQFLGYGYLRVISGDEMSKRAKFVFIKYLSKGLKMNLKALLNLHRGDVEKVLSQVNVSIEVDALDELDETEINERVSRAGGAHYN
jgi:hypothetical protein